MFSHLLIEAIIDTGTGSSFRALAAADNAPCIIKDEACQCQPFFALFREKTNFAEFPTLNLSLRSALSAKNLKKI